MDHHTADSGSGRLMGQGPCRGRSQQGPGMKPSCMQHAHTHTHAHMRRHSVHSSKIPDSFIMGTRHWLETLQPNRARARVGLKPTGSSGRSVNSATSQVSQVHTTVRRSQCH